MKQGLMVLAESVGRMVRAMSGEFDAATAVSLRGGGIYDTAIAEGWDIIGAANGGYMIALAARAMADAVGRPPLTITAHFLSPGRVGPAEIDVDVIRAGRRTATVSARMRSADAELLALLGTFGDQVPGGPSIVVGAPPELPPIEDCVLTPPPGEMSGFQHRVRSWVHPDDAGFAHGEPSGRAEIRSWFELADGSMPGVFGLLLAADASTPVVFNRREFPISWAPTLELTVHVRGVPAPGPLRVRMYSEFIENGMFEESGELWDSNGQLVAQSRQLALTPRT